MSIATAAKQVVVDRMDVVVAGGVESISLVQTPKAWFESDPELLAMHEDAFIAMIDTAEVVSRRYGISREAQDKYALESQKRISYSGSHGPKREWHCWRQHQFPQVPWLPGHVPRQRCAKTIYPGGWT